MSASENDTPAAALGQVIREWRIKRGLSTQELAAAARIGHHHLALIERGNPKAQLATRLKALADALQVRLSALSYEADRRAEALPIAQRAILLQLIDPAHPGPWTLAQLQEAIEDIHPGTLAAALGQLTACGVAVCEGEHFTASCSVRRLDALEMLSI